MNGVDKIPEYVDGWRRFFDIPKDELALRMHMSPSTLSRRMANPETLTLGEIDRLQNALNRKILEVCEHVYLQK